LSKSYVSQVKHGHRPPSKKLIQALQNFQSQHNNLDPDTAIALFLKSRREGLSLGTLDFYNDYLGRAIPALGLTPKPRAINAFLHGLECSEGGKHAYFRAIRVFYRWLYSPKSSYDLNGKLNPAEWIDAPKVPKLILPSLDQSQVLKLIDYAHSTRNKAIISLFPESGLRLSELTNIKPQDINWQKRTIKVLGKGRKEGLAPFGELSAQYLKQWLAQKPNGKNIWGLNQWGIASMLRRLEVESGIPANAHVFRRTFACLLRKAGVDTMTIKDLGRWDSISMVERYTRSITFNDAMKFYKAPLGIPPDLSSPCKRILATGGQR
jgi:integrase/recombinase XerC